MSADKDTNIFKMY